MKKVFNWLFSFLKYVLLLLSFGLTLFIILRMYSRLNKSLNSAIVIFIPYFILLFLFLLTSIFKREGITKNLFYNMTANLVFITNIFVCFRAIYDKNMLFNEIQKMGVNFNYFNDYLSFNRIMLYGLIIGNIVFLFIPSRSKEEYIVDLEKKAEINKRKEIEDNEDKVAKKIENNKEIEDDYKIKEEKELEEKHELKGDHKIKEDKGLEEKHQLKNDHKIKEDKEIEEKYELEDDHKLDKELEIDQELI